MAGGSGTRLWPLSRAQYPKQFLVLQGNRSLFQQAARAPAGAAARPTSPSRRPASSATRSTASWCSTSCASSTLPPATRAARADGPQHRAGDDAGGAAGERRRRRPGAGRHARPTRRSPTTPPSPPRCSSAVRGRGRRRDRDPRHHAGPARDRLRLHPRRRRVDGDGDARRVAQFVEKPDLATAERYLDAGGYFWNSGMFVRARVGLARGARALPPRHRRRDARGLGRHAAPTRASCGPARPSSPRSRASRSTTR